MHIVVVRGLWMHPLRVYVGGEVYWSVVFCLALLCSVGIYFATVASVPEEVRWAFGVLFGLLFVAASHNQGFLWNLWNSVEFERNGAHTIGRVEPVEEPSGGNTVIGLFMYADRIFALALLILGLVYFEDLGGEALQVFLFLTALCFYIGSWAAYLDPSAMHEGRCFFLRTNARWYILMTNFWHLTLAVLLVTLL